MPAQNPTPASPLTLFADGASSGNPGPGGWGVILVDAAQEVLELGGKAPNTTNNRMELTAVIEALRAISSRDLPGNPVRIHTDSTYVIQGITQWIHGWKRRGWKTVEGAQVLNRDLWEELETQVQAHAGKRRLEWNYVPGHSGVPGNERADEIAVQFSKAQSPNLYRGPLSGCAVRVMEIRPPSGSSSNAPYYLSYVDGTVERHATWPECEARVKGKAGARYKKVRSDAEERETLRSWGAA